MRMKFIPAPTTVDTGRMPVETEPKELDGPEAPATISMHEAAAILGVNVKTLYSEAKAGRFPVLRIGRKMLVSRTALDGILARGCLPR
jgi:excisionase family DNA binding protein